MSFVVLGMTSGIIFVRASGLPGPCALFLRPVVTLWTGGVPNILGFAGLGARCRRNIQCLRYGLLYNEDEQVASMEIVIETLRLILREFVRGDSDALEVVLSDPETMRFYPAPFDRDGVENWIVRNMQ